eukprot:scaffold1877_cov67-Phaeocystis_antarctica.AAC.11
MLSAAPNSGQKGLLRARLTRWAVEELHELQASGAACGDPGLLRQPRDIAARRRRPPLRPAFSVLPEPVRV